MNRRDHPELEVEAVALCCGECGCGRSCGTSVRVSMPEL